MKKKLSVLKSDRLLRFGFRCGLEKLENRILLTAQPFVGGDLVVYRVGDGTAALSNGGNPIFLDEYTPSGTLVQSIEMPFSTNPTDTQGGVTSPPATPNAIVNAGSATPSGVLQLSADGRYLTFTGYAANLPNLTGINLKASTFPRDVGRVDLNGNVDTSTALVDYAVANTAAGALSTDGSHFYVFSQQIDVARFANLGASTSTTLGPTGTGSTHFASMQIYNGQLYGMGTDGKVYQVGTGLPTSGTQTLTALPGVSLGTGTKPVDFFFVTVDPTHHGTQPDTLYVTDPSATYTVGTTTLTGAIHKFTATAFDPVTGAPTAWTSSGIVMVDPTNNKGGVTGLTGYFTGTSVVMFASSGAYLANAGQYGGAVYSFTDVLANDAADGTLPSTATATTIIPFFNANNFNQGLRGIAFVPNQSPALTGSNTNLPALLENPTSNPGQLVSAVISGLGANPISDTAGSRQGIAITAADQTSGTWQFSLNGGTSWQNFPAVSNSAALTLASDANTKIRFVPNAGFNGNATITFRAWDQSQGANGATFDITHSPDPSGTSPFSTASATATQTVNFVNQAPVFVRGPSQSILNTAGAQTVASWATNIGAGAANESTQSLNFIVQNNNNALFTAGGQPSIDASTGTLTYTPAAGANGTATVSVQLHDNGGTLNGGHDTSAVQTFQIAITPLGGNRPPVNTIPFATQTTLENQPLTFAGNSISISDPDAGTNPVQLTLTVVGGTATLSTTGGLTLISGANGTSSLLYQGTIASFNAALNGLIYTPTPNLNGAGAGQITMVTNDLGNTGTGGTKVTTDSITIDITPVNQAPSFTSGGNVTVPASGTYNQTWATNISAGANEPSQSVVFIVSNNNPSAFIVPPSISPTGVLTFTPVAGPASTTTVTVQLQDNGGTANGGNDKSATQTFLIQLTAVDLPPVISTPGGQRLIVNTPLLFASGQFNPAVANEYNAISVADPDGFLTSEQVALTATHGTLTMPSGSGVTITSGANNSAAVTFKGTLSQLNSALDGLTFTPTTGFTGTGANGASVTIALNDLSTTPPGPLTVTSTVNIDVVTAPPLVISELFLNPPGAPDHPNQYIEIRSATPNFTIPKGTMLVSVSGGPISTQIGNTVVNYPTGTVVDTFDLGGVKTGANGYLVILENGNSYNNFPAFGGLGLVNSQATVLDNGINPDGTIAIGTGAGFGNNSSTFGAPGSSIVGHSSLFRPNNVDIYKPSATFMLINSPGPVNPGDQLDSPLNVPPTGTLHGPQFSSWTVYDAVGGTISTQTQQGDTSYGFINYNDNTLPGFTNRGTTNATNIPAPFTPDYFGRANNNSGWVATDWVASSGISGAVPLFGLGNKNNTIPSSDANRPLNNIGGPNFDVSQPPVVTTAQRTVNYPIGSGPIVIDPTVTVTDADSTFLASAQVAITANYNATTDSLNYAGNNPNGIQGSFDSTTGILTLTGLDTLADWNAALQSVTFTYSGSVVANPARTITFKANDGLVLSDPTHSVDFINIQGPVASPPIVTGTTIAPITWTEALPPATPPAVLVAPSLSIADGSTTQLTSATVSISANFNSGEDVLGWNATVATTNHITVTSSTHSHTLVLTPTTPDTSESLAAFQAVLRTVTYSDSSQNPTTAPRTITFTVVDANNITSSITVASQQVVNLVAVNNPPTLTASAGTNSYTAGTSAILVDGGITATDPDTANMTGATVSITGGFANGDTLSFVNQLGITGSFNATSGVLSLTGSAVPRDYQVALRAITFSTASSAAAGTRTISSTLNDGVANSNTATKQIGVQKNTTPLAGDFTLDGHVNAADVSAMLTALADLNAFKTAHSLSPADLLAIGDVNHDGAVTNRDLQALLSLLISGGGSGSEAAASPSAASASASGRSSVSLGHAILPTALAPLNGIAANNFAANALAPAKLILQSPAAWTDSQSTNHLPPASVDQTVSDTISFRSRHLALGPVKPNADDAGDDLANISGLV
jgi:Bacterial Ig domain